MRLNTEARKIQITEAALQLIHEEGFDSLTTRELAKRVGISEPALYRHFSKKEDIILSILDRMRYLGDVIKSDLENKNDCVEKLQTFIETHFEYFEKSPYMVTLLFSDVFLIHYPILSAKLNEVTSIRYQLLKKIFTTCKEEGKIGNDQIDDWVTLTLGIIRIKILLWWKSGFSISLQNQGQRAINFITELLNNKR